MKYSKGKTTIEASTKAYDLIYKELGFKPVKVDNKSKDNKECNDNEDGNVNQEGEGNQEGQ